MAEINKFTWHVDPAHAWLQVAKTCFERVGLDESNITKYSYQDNEFYYLEEDCDAATFLNALPSSIVTIDGVVHDPIHYSEIHYTDYAFIRNLERVR